MFWYGRERWRGSCCKKSRSDPDERRELLNSESNSHTSADRARWNSFPRIVVAAFRIIGIMYVSVGLICFAMGLFWRTRSFYALLGPIAVLAVVVTSMEYYAMKNGRLQRCEEVQRRVTLKLLPNSNSGQHEEDNSIVSTAIQ